MRLARYFGCSTALLAVALVAQSQKPKIFVKDSSSWRINHGGGARPQTAEIIKTFHERCPAVTVTMKQDAADYIVQLDHEAGKDFFLRRNKVVVFDNKSGDAFFSESTRTLGNAVKEACAAIGKHRP